MEPLELNLASQPFRNNTLLWLGYGLGAALVLGFGVWSVTTHAHYRAELSRLRGELTTIDNDLGRLARREAAARTVLGRRDLDVETLRIQAEKANEVIGWKAFSWTRLFNRLEGVVPWNVSLSAVRPLFQAGARGTEGGRNRDQGVIIAVDGYSKDLVALLDFERALFEDPYFDEPEPERHAPGDRGDLVFSMRFTYVPDGPPAVPGKEGPQEAPQEGPKAAEPEEPAPQNGATAEAFGGGGR